MYQDTQQVKPAVTGLSTSAAQNQSATTLNVKLVIGRNCPFMHPKKFASECGVSAGVVGGWIDRGYLPTMRVGKYRMINIPALIEQCRNDIAFTVDAGVL